MHSVLREGLTALTTHQEITDRRPSSTLSTQLFPRHFDLYSVCVIKNTKHKKFIKPKSTNRPFIVHGKSSKRSPKNSADAKDTES